MSEISERYITMGGLEDIETPLKRDPTTLSPHQRAVWESVDTPKKYSTLYRRHSERMPSSSVRRIMNSLLAEGLVRKVGGHRWVQTK